jgi:hypothetical protein
MASFCRRIIPGLFAVLFSSACLAVGQSTSTVSIRDVDVCQLLQNPEAFDGQILRFHGRLDLEFEGNHIDDTACHLPLRHRRIWWNYGGESLAVNLLETKRIADLTTPVVNDAQLSEFKSTLSKRRSHRPDGSKCSSHHECAYYDVSATFVGKFFAGKWTQIQGKLFSGGFGHMNCCHLFVVEQVSEVVAKRTAVPDDEKSYTCVSTEWQGNYPSAKTTSVEERADLNRQFLSEQIRAHSDGALADSMSSAPSWQYTGLTGSVCYLSPDLLTSYLMQFPSIPKTKSKDKKAAGDAGSILVTVTKERCSLALAN